jgi:hypothetical protein
VTFESIERIRLFVRESQRRLRISAVNLRQGGYKELALEKENEAQVAELILRDMANEHGAANVDQAAETR